MLEAVFKKFFYQLLKEYLFTEALSLFDDPVMRLEALRYRALRSAANPKPITERFLRLGLYPTQQVLSWCMSALRSSFPFN